MKKIFFTLGLIGCLSFAGATGAEASLSSTFTGGQGCTCNDSDNWVDLNKPSSVTVTCPSFCYNSMCTPGGTSVYHDTALPNNTIQEYSCSTFPGATAVSTDLITHKVMASYITKQCPKGYTATYIKKPIKPNATAVEKSFPSVLVGYCAKITAVPNAVVPTAVKE